ncbi:MAG: ABC transporter permease [Oscillospiraceae bacterium]|jgi:ABC-type antimicrobial peptide transport system permease subunit|nr:ABC transporter permease [Oscillospiraceae bacterium]
MQKRFSAHLFLALVITSVLTISLMLSIYRDSDLNGTRLFYERSYHDGMYVVINCDSDDVSNFSDLPGLSPVYENGSIYLYQNDDNETIDQEQKNRTVVELITISNRLNSVDGGKRGANIINNAVDPSFYKTADAFLLLLALFMLISAFILYKSYAVHMSRFREDVSVLRYYGATKRKIRFMFLFELVLTFFISSAISIAVSGIIMSKLFIRYIQTQDVGNLGWIVFRIDWMHSVTVLSAFFLFMIISLFIVLRTSRGTPTKKYKQTLDTTNRHETNDSQRAAMPIVKKIYHRAFGRQLKICLWVSLPIALLLLLVFDWFYLSFRANNVAPEYAIVVRPMLHKDVVINYTPEFERPFLGISGVASVYVEPILQVFLLNEDAESMDNTDNSEISEPDYISPFYLDSAAIKLLESNDEMWNERTQNDNQKPIDLYMFDLGSEAGFKLAATLKDGYYAAQSKSNNSLNVYVNEDRYAELLYKLPINNIYIGLSDEANEEYVVSELRNLMPPDQYEIVNNAEMYRHLLNTTRGYYILLAFITIVLLLFIIIVLSAIAYEMVNANKQLLAILHQLGTNRRTLSLAYLKMVAKAAIISIAVSIFVSLGLFEWVAILSGFPFSADPILFHLLISGVVLCAYMIPAKSSLKQLQAI